jgi:Amidohydrolase family
VSDRFLTVAAQKKSPRSALFYARASLTAVGILLSCATGLHAQALIFRHVTVIDATGAAPQKDVDVAIDGPRIVTIAKKIRLPRAEAARVRIVEAKGKFLIPGLWDMHVHLSAPEIYFPLLVANGITGVREMFSGIPIQTIRQWRALPDVPRIVAPGFLDGPPMLSGGTPPPGAIAIGTPDQARFAVRALAQSGVDFIKVYNSIPRDAYFALAAEARAIGIPFAGHVPEAVSPAEASGVGQHSQEHLINILLACSTKEAELRAARVAMMLDPNMTGEARMRELGFPNPAGLIDTYDEQKAAALFQTFVRNGTWQTPTLALLDGFAHARDENVVNDPRRKYFPKVWTDAWDPRKTYFLRDLFVKNAVPDDRQYNALNVRIRVLLERYEKLVGDMHRAGVEFLAGTDANGVNPVMPGFGLHRELELLVAAGLTPLEALQCATRNPARYFGQATQGGTVEVGKAADLVLLNADPLSDIGNTRQIEAVVMRGRYYSRADLDAMLSRVAEQVAK